MKLLIIGGHLTPALSLIEGLPEDTNVVYVGRKYALEGNTTPSLEYQSITARKIPFMPIITGRLQRKWTKYTFFSLLKLPIGFFQAFTILRKVKTTVIIGFGGYVQVPLCIIGKMLGIPIVIHEQTLEAGLANKIIAPLANKVCISWESSSKFFPREKTVLTGNPAVTTVSQTENSVVHHPKKMPTLVIVGGSQGSHAINLLVSHCLEKLLEQYFVIHQTGDARAYNDFAMLEKAKGELSPLVAENYTLKKFIDPDDMMTVFQQADLVISRAGVNTVTTLLLLNKPALCIPLPISQHDEQKKNAIFCREHGLGEVLDQNTITPAQFLSCIHDMIKNIKRYTNKKDTAEIAVHKHAIANIREVLLYVEKNASQEKSKIHY
jgi:UDP-N-acetylglucosamine--N-acetylmuramyl-(pentapeptide) pyrophosphoryl-undecaprenol N-acetylglucosamine transferase